MEDIIDVQTEGEEPMTESRVLIFAGTTEGRKLSEYLVRHAVRVHVCVATEYGGSLLPAGKSITVSSDRMTAAQMERFIEEFEPNYVVDATHPYADEVTYNIQKACGACKKKYLRLIRESSAADGCIYVDNVEEAVSFLNSTKGNILAATGSKELQAYTKLEDYKNRLYARVLSVADVIEKCRQLDVRGRHLICMQGPFSVELNMAMLKEYQIEWFVTKESGKEGGFPEKCEAARRVKTKLLVIGRPGKQEDGYTLGEMCRLLKTELLLSGSDDTRRRKVTLVGIGTGSRSYLTIRAEKICRQAELIIGAERIAKAAALSGQDVYFEYRTAEIARYIEDHPEYRDIAVVFSGDVGFYSGAKKLSALLRGESEWGRNPNDKKETEQGITAEQREEAEQKIEIEVVPGISSVVYFCAKLHIPWEDAALVSIHGRKEHVISVIRDNEKTIALMENAGGVRKFGMEMTEYGYGGLTVCVGESLSYDDEKIVWFTAEALCHYNGSDLAVLYIYNPEGGKSQTRGISDAAFVRGKVPMTKEEARSVSILKLCLKKNSIVYDIGAGTGSVSVEAAAYAVKGEVYAIEEKEEAAVLILENKRKFKTDNLTIIQGEAPEALEGLPVPDCVFIGGSGGRLKEILFKLKEFFLYTSGQCTDMRVVINAITLETLSEAVQCLGELKKNAGIRIAEEEIVQLSSARSKNTGDYHMMMGQNPVFIISFQVVCEK